ncbi:MAG: MtaA/CmuA family methyltransferase [Chloroflexota bacterium]
MAMTSRERVFAALTRAAVPDRLPVVPLLMARGIREGGITMVDAARDGRLSARAKAKALEVFGGDVVIAGTDLFNPVESLGAELELMPRAQPTLVRHPAPTRDAFERLRDRYAADGFRPAPRLVQTQLEAEELVRLGFKQTHAIPAPVGGPVTTAAGLMGSTEFLAALNDDPAYAHEVLALATDAVKHTSRLLFEAGVDAVNILDPFASSDVLSPEFFREFGLPYFRDIFGYVHGELGGAGFLHICTYTGPIWEDVLQTGALNFNGDLYPGADLAKRAIGDRISLMGTVSPFSTMVHGTPEDVAAESRKLAVEVGLEGGFVLMPGCDIDWTVPAANLHALMATAASITYPIDVEALGDLSGVAIAGHPEHRGKRASSTARAAAAPSAATGASADDRVLATLVDAVLEYDGNRAVAAATEGLRLGMTPQRLVFDGLAAGMRIVGDLYERNERFVVDMVKAARTMDQAMTVITPVIERSADGAKPAGIVVLGLIRGNTQDIGKNLVALMLRANGYRVIDLGKNVRPEAFLAAADEHGADAIGVSVMLNASVAYVEELVELARGQGRRELVMFGGAAATRDIGERLGIAYGADANDAVRILRDGLAA